MRIKPGVILDGIQTPMLNVLVVVNAAYARQGIEVWVTCGLDGEHMEGSLHDKGLALDFRTRKIRIKIIEAIAAEVKTKLGDAYDVMIEKDHLHVEHDPKQKGNK